MFETENQAVSLCDMKKGTGLSPDPLAPWSAPGGSTFPLNSVKWMIVVGLGGNYREGTTFPSSIFEGHMSSADLWHCV